MRIIAGKHRGRVLRAPRGLKTRPTTDRVREAVFSILGDVTGQRILDCYAGTGALGLEALSRGAALAVFVESSREASRAIRRNVQTLGVESQSLLLSCRVEHATPRLQKLAPMDCILADPPWPICQEASKRVAQLAQLVLDRHGLLVLGHPATETIELDPRFGFQLDERRRWGDSAMSWFSPFHHEF